MYQAITEQQYDTDSYTDSDEETDREKFERLNQLSTKFFENVLYGARSDEIDDADITLRKITYLHSLNLEIMTRIGIHDLSVNSIDLHIPYLHDIPKFRSKCFDITGNSVLGCFLHGYNDLQMCQNRLLCTSRPRLTMKAISSIIDLINENREKAIPYAIVQELKKLVEECHVNLGKIESLMGSIEDFKRYSLDKIRPELKFSSQIYVNSHETINRLIEEILSSK